MDVNVRQVDGQARLELRGRFDYTSHRSFRQACETAFSAAGVSEMLIDMQEVEYLDSSALGMLLLLRDKCKAASRPLSLVNCGDTVRDVLKVANFDKLFILQ